MPACNPADLAYIQRCRQLIAITLVLFLIANHFLSQRPTGIYGLLLAAATGTLFFALLLITSLLVVRMLDEFQRVLFLRSFLWAAGLTMAFACVWGYMEQFPGAPASHLPPLILPVMLVCFTSAIKVFIFRRHKSPAE